MDPNANLREQERIIRNGEAVGNQRLRELRIALRVWLQHGGFEPDWFQAPEATAYFQRESAAARAAYRDILHGRVQ